MRVNSEILAALSEATPGLRRYARALGVGAAAAVADGLTQSALQSVGAGFERITPSIGSAARLLGRGPWDSLRRVYLPLVAPSVLTAALLVFVDVMKELPATLMLRPFNFDTLAIAANNYASDERLYWAAAPSLAIVAAGIVPCILLIRGIAASAQGQGESEPLP